MLSVNAVKITSILKETVGFLLNLPLYLASLGGLKWMEL
jgi:hypothetical protein